MRRFLNKHCIVCSQFQNVFRLFLPPIYSCTEREAFNFVFQAVDLYTYRINVILDILISSAIVLIRCEYRGEGSYSIEVENRKFCDLHTARNKGPSEALGTISNNILFRQPSPDSFYNYYRIY